MFARLYSGEDGLAHFDEFDPGCKWRTQWSEKMMGGATERLLAESYFFEPSPPGYFVDLHNPPRRRYSVPLQGQVEVRNGAGEERGFGVSGVMQAEAFTGKGYSLHMVGDEQRYSMVIRL